MTELELPEYIVAATISCYIGSIDETICIFPKIAKSLFEGEVGKSCWLDFQVSISQHSPASEERNGVESGWYTRLFRRECLTFIKWQIL